jgi:hypothetical protein
VSASRRTIRLHDELVPCASSPWRHDAIRHLAMRTMLSVVAVDEVCLMGDEDVLRDVLAELEHQGAHVVMHAMWQARGGMWRAHLRHASVTAGDRR